MLDLRKAMTTAYNAVWCHLKARPSRLPQKRSTNLALFVTTNTRPGQTGVPRLLFRTSLHDKALIDGGAVMRAFNRENWEAANEQLGYFLKVLADEGYPDELIADVIMALGVLLIDQVYGRDMLVRHLSRLLLTAFDPKADMSTAPKFLQ